MFLVFLETKADIKRLALSVLARSPSGFAKSHLLELLSCSLPQQVSMERQKQALSTHSYKHTNPL